MRVFSCLGLLAAKLNAAGGLRLSALSLWLGRAFVAYSSEYITKAKPLGLHARVQLPGAAAGQARRGRRAAAQRTLAVIRPRVPAWGCCRPSSTRPAGCGLARSRCGSAARSLRTVVSTLQKLNLLVYMRVFSCLGLLPANLDAAGGLRLSALSLWLGRACLGLLPAKIDAAGGLRLSALSLWLGRACLGLLPAKLNAAGGLRLSALSLWLGRAFVAYSSEYITKINLLVCMRVFSCRRGCCRPASTRR
ncbi:hypothetical protein EVAR_42719_1 [Eumeta japonica]|uniref:Uncharacterized protein n=1 Tax=Eumeta variegata TaxID=151549 RepID=A0A4C1XL06_EUMVA|nr:hypothetical protein EVAR_42719_1 [Eumeta japonica]